MSVTQSDADRLGGQSLAHKTRDAIRQLIESEALGPGDRVPTEAQVAERFGVGRTTIREAFRLLEQEGVVVSKQGTGRFVRDYSRLQRPLTKLEGVTDMLDSRGFTVATQVVSVGVDEPTDRERSSLELESSKSVVRLVRLRQHRERTLVYSVDIFDRSIFHAPLSSIDWTDSLFALMQGQGVTVTSADATVSATLVTPDSLVGLDVETPEAWLLIEQLHRDQRGRPAILSEDYHRGTDFQFDVSRSR